jgi:hypothetical protein
MARCPSPLRYSLGRYVNQGYPHAYRNDQYDAGLFGKEAVYLYCTGAIFYKLTTDCRGDPWVAG